MTYKLPSHQIAIAYFKKNQARLATASAGNSNAKPLTNCLIFITLVLMLISITKLTLAL